MRHYTIGMWLLDRLAEQHIQDAAERGVFDDLPGAGKPLRLEDDSLVPPELRAGFRLLRNSGHLPPELELRRELKSVEQLLAHAETSHEQKARARKRLTLLQAQIGESRLGRALRAHPQYERRLLDRLTRE